MSSTLALLGGRPVITKPMPHFTWPPLTEGTTKAVLDQLASSISLDDRCGVVAALEEGLCEYFGVKHAVLTSSGTAALYSIIVVPRLRVDVRSSWYGLILHYRSEELGGLPIGRFAEALKAEGAYEVDRPGSTCPLNLLPLFQEPGPLFPRYEGKLRYARGDFPCAEEMHRTTLKLPVWHRPEDMPLVDDYIKAFCKVTEHYRDLLG